MREKRVAPLATPLILLISGSSFPQLARAKIEARGFFLPIRVIIVLEAPGTILRRHPAPASSAPVGRLIRVSVGTRVGLVLRVQLLAHSCQQRKETDELVISWQTIALELCEFSTESQNDSRVFKVFSSVKHKCGCDVYI